MKKYCEGCGEVVDSESFHTFDYDVEVCGECHDKAIREATSE